MSETSSGMSVTFMMTHRLFSSGLAVFAVCETVMVAVPLDPQVIHITNYGRVPESMRGLMLSWLIKAIYDVPEPNNQLIDIWLVRGTHKVNPNEFSPKYTVYPCNNN